MQQNINTDYCWLLIHISHLKLSWWKVCIYRGEWRNFFCMETFGISSLIIAMIFAGKRLIWNLHLNSKEAPSLWFDSLTKRRGAHSDGLSSKNAQERNGREASFVFHWKLWVCNAGIVWVWIAGFVVVCNAGFVGVCNAGCLKCTGERPRKPCAG